LQAFPKLMDCNLQNLTWFSEANKNVFKDGTTLV